MTVNLYLQDSYLSEFSANVVARDDEKNALLLDQSAFYPGGGGQLCDVGTLRSDDADFTVSKVLRGNLHVIDGELQHSAAKSSGKSIGIVATS